jgi:hypothetical protein
MILHAGAGRADDRCRTQTVVGSSWGKAPANTLLLQARSGADTELLSIHCPKFGPESEALANGHIRKPAQEAGFAQAADGTRTHDLLHGKQYVESPIFSMHADFFASADAIGLHPITAGSGTEEVPALLAPVERWTSKTHALLLDRLATAACSASALE